MGLKKVKTPGKSRSETQWQDMGRLLCFLFEIAILWELPAVESHMFVFFSRCLGGKGCALFSGSEGLSNVDGHPY